MELLEAGDCRLTQRFELHLARQAVVEVPRGDQAVEEARQRMLRWIDGHPDALLRTCLDAHLTASALVVDPSSGAVLLLHHRKLQRWLQPGGHADGEGNLAAAALREAVEATGIPGLRVAVPAIDLDVHRVAPPAEGPHLHLDVRYLVVAPAGARPEGNHESTELRFVDPSELEAYDVDDGLRRLVRVGQQALTTLAR
jgi:8-oxo-dGTP pyrophosphatase MutT (NUDIX family)